MLQENARRANAEMTMTQECGAFCFHPHCLQKCGSVGLFVGFLCFANMEAQGLIAYLSTQITAIEKQFGFTSSQTGILLACNDIGFLTFALLMGYLAPKVHIPRFLSFATFLISISAFICALPYFVSLEQIRGESFNRLSKLPDIKTIEMMKAMQRQTASVHNHADTKTTLFSNTTTTSEKIGYNTTTPKSPSVKTRRSSSSSSSSSSVSDIGELNPFLMMTLFAPRCTAIPKPPSNCAVVSKMLNKGSTNRYTGMAFALLAVGIILQGISKSPRMPMTLLYLDDNGSKARLPLYIGLLVMSVTVGLVFVFGLGVLSSSLYVTLEDVPIHPLNPHWIGAWWLGFMVIGGISLLATVPLMCFPKRLQSKRSSQHIESTTCTDGNRHQKTTPKATVKEVVLSMKRCLSNPVLVGVTFCSAAIYLIMAGSLPFDPKYIETQFTVPAWKANLYAAITKVIPAISGACLAGGLITRMKLSPLTMSKAGLGCSVVVLLCGLLLLTFGCKTVTIVGFNDKTVGEQVDSTSLNSTACASTCHCQTVDYFPVCGSDGQNYFSACHAGCTASKDTVFTDCSCIAGNGTADLGLCQEDSCNMLIPYMLTIALISLAIAAISIIVMVLGLRSVSDKDRGLAVALLSVIANIIGWLPAPIIFGKLVDSACMMWRTSCAHLHKGACTVYDIERFRQVYAGYVVVTGVLMVGGMLFVFFKSRTKTDWNWSAQLLNTHPDIEDASEAGEQLMDKPTASLDA